MTAGDARARYLTRRADLEGRPLEGARAASPQRVVVIPALAETEELPETLASLAANPPALLESTQVVVVVNNQAPDRAGPESVADNAETLRRLRADSLVDADAGLHVAWVDASSNGRELDSKEGVGTARKLGLDWGLELLNEPRGVLICLDADARVEPSYLEAVHAHFEDPKAWGAVLSYAHEMPEDRLHRDAIAEYECYLRTHALGLRRADSPYAVHTIGSTLACSGAAYVAAGGMNRRPAAEDFYFVQQLVKTGPMAEITDTVVHPSARASARAHLGTGSRIAKRLREPGTPITGYHPDSYAVLRRWLGAVRAGLDKEDAALLEEANAIEPALAGFLEDNGFRGIWSALRMQHRSARGRSRAFHVWFDGLRTLRLLHRLRDAGYADRPLHECAAQLTAGETIEKPMDLLEHLRRNPLPPLVPIDGGV